MKLYTDGACSPNPGLGGWAAIFINKDGNVVKHCGYLEDTTNNVMEITAALEGLKALVGVTKEVEVFSDSQYVIQTMCGYWRKSKNIQLWNQLDDVIKNFDNVTWHWVKGHESNLYNNMCDELAVMARTNKVRF